MPEKIMVDFEFSSKQRAALRALEDPQWLQILWGGSRGAGKSLLGVRWAFLQAVKIIKQFNLQPSAHPPVIGFLGRKRATDFNATTLNTFKQFVPANAYTMIEHKKIIRIQNTVDLMYGGLDDSETINKFLSAEFSFFFADQGEELTQEDAGMLLGTLRQRFNGKSPDYKAFYTANPAQCWIKQRFITNPEPRCLYIKALPSDNPFLDPGYIDKLRQAFSFNPQLLQAFIYGSWDDLDTAYTVIPSSAIEKCVDSGYTDRSGEKRITVCDIAEDGSDETVIYDFVNSRVKTDTIEIYSHRDLMDSCGRIQAHAKKNGSNLICIDKVGLGAGVYSRLQEIYGQSDDDPEGTPKVTVYGFDGRISPPGALNDMTFKNYKTYAWFKARDIIKEGRCDIPNDSVLKSQLAGVTWKFTSGEVIMLDTNQDVKERLGQSPDRATTLIMGLDALSRASIIKPYDKYSRPQYNRARMGNHRVSWATV